MSNENTAKVVIQKAKCYIVELSTKRTIKCDADEVAKVIEGLQTGSVVKLRQGIFNPSYFVDLIEDEERRVSFVEKIRDIERHNQQDIEYHGGKAQRRLPSGMNSLKDIFEGTKLKSLPTNEIKRLN